MKIAKILAGSLTSPTADPAPANGTRASRSGVEFAQLVQEPVEKAGGHPPDRRPDVSETTDMTTGSETDNPEDREGPDPFRSGPAAGDGYEERSGTGAREERLRSAAFHEDFPRVPQQLQEMSSTENPLFLRTGSTAGEDGELPLSHQKQLTENRGGSAESWDQAGSFRDAERARGSVDGPAIPTTLPGSREHGPGQALAGPKPEGRALAEVGLSVKPAPGIDPRSSGADSSTTPDRRRDKGPGAAFGSNPARVLETPPSAGGQSVPERDGFAFAKASSASVKTSGVAGPPGSPIPSQAGGRDTVRAASPAHRPGRITGSLGGVQKSALEIDRVSDRLAAQPSSATSGFPSALQSNGLSRALRSGASESARVERDTLQIAANTVDAAEQFEAERPRVQQPNGHPDRDKTQLPDKPNAAGIGTGSQAASLATRFFEKVTDRPVPDLGPGKTGEMTGAAFSVTAAAGQEPDQTPGDRFPGDGVHGRTRISLPETTPGKARVAGQASSNSATVQTKPSSDASLGAGGVIETSGKVQLTILADPVPQMGENRATLEIAAGHPVSPAPSTPQGTHYTIRTIAQQMVHVLPQAVDRPVEISLNPEELGRVRLALTVSDTGVVVSMTAERPETLDLLRRHSEDLAQAFRALGYEDIGFSFGTGSGAQDETGQDREQHMSGSTANPDNSFELPHDAVTASSDGNGSTGLDLRL